MLAILANFYPDCSLHLGLATFLTRTLLEMKSFLHTFLCGTNVLVSLQVRSTMQQLWVRGLMLLDVECEFRIWSSKSKRMPDHLVLTPGLSLPYHSLRHGS